MRTPRSDSANASRAFTLLEMLAVVAIIALLALMVIGIAGYADKRAADGNARALIASLEAAIENFKSDNGSYPTSGLIRASVTAFPFSESTNSWLLYQQLSGRYYKFRPGQIQNPARFVFAGTNFFDLTRTLIMDPWGKSLNYFNPANPALAIGTKTNKHSYDLSSSGRDRTYGMLNGVNDDIRNWN